MARFPREPFKLLRGVPLFAKLSDRELRQIDRLVDEIEVAEGETLVEQGAFGAQQSFVIAAGEAEVLIDGRVVATLGTGALFGEMAMLDHKPRSATVVARSPMRLLVIGPEAFNTFIRQPKVMLAALKGVSERLRHVQASSGSEPGATEPSMAPRFTSALDEHLINRSLQHVGE